MPNFMGKYGAGYFDRPLTHLVRSVTTDAEQGREYTFSQSKDAPVYWGHVEQTGSTEVEVNNRLLTKIGATITIRGWVSINTLDRLVDQQFNETYIVASVARGDDCFKLECHKW